MVLTVYPNHVSIVYRSKKSSLWLWSCLGILWVFLSSVEWGKLDALVCVSLILLIDFVCWHDCYVVLNCMVCLIAWIECWLCLDCGDWENWGFDHLSKLFFIMTLITIFDRSTGSGITIDHLNRSLISQIIELKWLFPNTTLIETDVALSASLVLQV